MIHSWLYVLLTFVTLLFSDPTPSAHTGAVSVQPHTPIIVYHHISDRQHDRWFVPPKLFEQQLGYLKDHGFHSASMEMYGNALQIGTPLPDKSIILTFDDGYDDMYTTAFPLLKQYGFTGTFYIITGFVGTPGYLTWEEISEMQKAGMEFGGHTIHHVMLTKLSLLDALWEMLDSRLELQEHLNAAVTTFAYPFNDHNRNTIKLAWLAGYSTAVIVDWHTGDRTFTPYRIARISVESGESISVFKLVVNRGYEPPHFDLPVK